MKTIRQILDIARRELQLFSARPILLVCMVVAPLVCLYFFTDLMHEGVPTDLPAAIVDEDNTLITRTMALYAFVVVTHIFTLPELGHWVPFLAFVLPYLLACIGLGGILAEFVYRREDCILLFVFLSVPLLFLSGVSWPNTHINPLWQIVGACFPSTFGMNAYVRITSMGASTADIRPEITALWIQAAIYYTICFILTARHKQHYLHEV